MTRLCSLPLAAAGIILTAGAAVVLADTTRTFNVVTFANKVQVLLANNATVSLKQLDSEQPYFTGSTTLADDHNIKYTVEVDGEVEKFERTFPGGRSSTFNDFFGRKDTIVHLPRLDKPFKDEPHGQWLRSMGRVGPFNETYIPTVHIFGKAVDQAFCKRKMDEKVVPKVNAFIVLQDSVHFLKNITLIGGNDFAKKISFRLLLGDNADFYGRDELKFRFGEEDPTMLRESLYTDMLEAVGNPVHKTNFARVYANKTPIGLYILQDFSGSSKFIETEFYGHRNKPAELGYPLDATTGADFEWVESSRHPIDPWDSFTPTKEGQTNDRVVDLSYALHILDVNDEDAVRKFDKEWFSLDVFYKALALEFLTGHWDSYLGLTSNYVVYDDPTESGPDTYKFYFIDHDFEFTFGMCMNSCFNQYDDAFPLQSYKTILNRTWGCDLKHGRDKKHRAMMDKLLSSEAQRARFEDIIRKIVHHMFNPVAMSPLIDALAARIRPEVEWDRSLPHIRNTTRGKGGDRSWSFADFDKGLDGPIRNAAGEQKGGAAWGLKDFISERAGAMTRELGPAQDRPAHSSPLSDHSSPIESAAGAGSQASAGGGSQTSAGGGSRTSAGGESQVLAGGGSQGSAGGESQGSAGGGSQESGGGEGQRPNGSATSTPSSIGLTVLSLTTIAVAAATACI